VGGNVGLGRVEILGRPEQDRLAAAVEDPVLEVPAEVALRASDVVRSVHLARRGDHRELRLGHVDVEQRVVPLADEAADAVAARDLDAQEGKRVEAGDRLARRPRRRRRPDR
jgi:hypothetical protein